MDGLAFVREDAFVCDPGPWLDECFEGGVHCDGTRAVLEVWLSLFESDS